MLTVADLEALRHTSIPPVDRFCGRPGTRPSLPFKELLEKPMDVADLADAAATRLIFRGLPLPPSA